MHIHLGMKLRKYLLTLSSAEYFYPMGKTRDRSVDPKDFWEPAARTQGYWCDLGDCIGPQFVIFSCLSHSSQLTLSRLPIFLNPISYPPPVIPSSFHLSFIFCEEGFTMLYVIGVGHSGLGNICNFQYSLQSILGYFIRSSLAAPSSSKLHTPTPKQSHIISLSLFAWIGLLQIA